MNKAKLFKLSALAATILAGVMGTAQAQLFTKTITADDWLMGRPAEERTTTGGVFNTTLPTTTTLVTYLTGTKGQMVTLAENQTLRFNYAVSFSGNLSTGGGAIRAGVFNTDLSTFARVTGFREDATDTGGWDSAVTADTFRNSLGFASFLNGPGDTQSVNMRRRQGNDNAGLISATSQYSNTGSASSMSGAMSEGTVYYGLLEFTLNGENNMSQRAVLWYVDDGNDVFLYDFTVVNTASATFTTDFDLVTLHFSDAVADEISIHSASVTVIPEPSTYALLAVSLTVLVLLRRRRGTC